MTYVLLVLDTYNINHIYLKRCNKIAEMRKALMVLTKKFGAIILFILLLAFWFILSFKINLTIAVIGFFVSTMVVFFNYDLVFNNQEASKLTFRTIKKFIVLFFVLIFNIIKSNIEVAKIVLSPKMPIDPGFVTIKNPLKKELNQALFANAITLTPGTLTVDMNKDEIVVHGLVKEHVKHLDGSSLERAFMALEGDKND
jgi:multicomponent Na+:H+ antiporter subunit E